MMLNGCGVLDAGGGNGDARQDHEPTVTAIMAKSQRRRALTKDAGGRGIVRRRNGTRTLILYALQMKRA